MSKKKNSSTRQQIIKEALAKKPSANAGLFVNNLLSEINKNIKEAKVMSQRVVRGRKSTKIPAKRPEKIIQPAIKKAFIAPEYTIFETPEWFFKDEPVDISIIIPCFKSKNEIIEQIESWDVKDDGLTKEIIYVDDCCPQKSHQGILDAWEKRKNEIKSIGKIIITGRNAGFSNACNSGFKVAKGKYIVFLNADTKVTTNWIRPMYDCFQDEDVGIVGNLQLKNDNTIDSCGSEWDWKHGAFLHRGRHIFQKSLLNKPFNLDNAPKDLLKKQEVEMVTGACVMLPKIFFEKIEGFDTEYRIGYWEDADLCMKVHINGKKVLFTPDSIIYHKGGHTHSAAHAYSNENKNLFHRKWVNSKILHGFLDDTRGKHKHLFLDPKSIVVYTAITNKSNEYDTLKEQPPNAKNVDFIAFLESPVENKTWSIHQIEKKFTDPNRNAKIHKILPHVYFPDKLYSLWIDGTITIKFPYSIEKLIELYLADCDFALFKHSERNCIYQEANVCMQRNLDDHNVIRKQIERYTKDGHPTNYGLGECSVLLRRHTDSVKKFNEAWWEEICSGSKRDQISFSFLVKKMNLKVKYFPGHLRAENYLFHRAPHKNQRKR